MYYIVLVCGGMRSGRVVGGFVVRLVPNIRYIVSIFGVTVNTRIPNQLLGAHKTAIVYKLFNYVKRFYIHTLNRINTHRFGLYNTRPSAINDL